MNIKQITQERFIKIMKALIKIGTVKNKSQFAKSIGSYAHVIARIERSESSVSIPMIERLVKKYQVNANYLFNKSDVMFIEHLDEGTLIMIDKKEKLCPKKQDTESL